MSLNFPFGPNNSANIVHMFAEILQILFDNELVYWPTLCHELDEYFLKILKI
jgi:hypothetical protein